MFIACVGAEDASVSVEAGDTSAMMGVEDGDPLGVTEVGEDVAGVVVVDGNGVGDGEVVVLLDGGVFAVVEAVVKVETEVETGLV